MTRGMAFLALFCAFFCLGNLAHANGPVNQQRYASGIAVCTVNIVRSTADAIYDVVQAYHGHDVTPENRTRTLAWLRQNQGRENQPSHMPEFVERTLEAISFLRRVGNHVAQAVGGAAQVAGSVLNATSFAGCAVAYDALLKGVTQEQWTTEVSEGIDRMNIPEAAKRAMKRYMIGHYSDMLRTIRWMRGEQGPPSGELNRATQP